MKKVTDLVGIDTSVVLRLLTGEPESQFTKAVAFLDSLLRAGKTAAVNDLVVSEAYFALQYHYDLPKAKALNTLQSFLNSDEIECLGVADKVLEVPDLANSNPGFVDRLIHGGYANTCEGIATFEKSAQKLPNTRILTD